MRNSTYAIAGIISVCAIALSAPAAYAMGSNERPACDFKMAGHTASRTIAWDGSDTVGISGSADVRYTHGVGDSVTISGDANQIQHMQVRDGNIEMDCRGWYHGDRMTITLPGRNFSKFSLAGSGSMLLNGIDQPTLRLDVAGSGDITANGKTQNLEISIAGSGQMHLGKLAVTDATVSVAGSGDTEIAPSGKLAVEIAGSGRVRLLNEPKHIETHIAGSGEILHGQ